MRVLFAGSPAIAVPSLTALAGGGGTGFTLAGLLTNPDAPRGRSGRPEPTECAAALTGLYGEIPVLKPERLDAEARERVSSLKSDLLVSFAYGKIFGPKFLALFPAGGINVHPSLLPKYRGPAPIPAAILARDSVTGITVQRLAAEMDSGDILMQETLPLCGRETTETLSLTVAAKSAEMLAVLLGKMAAGTVTGRPQNPSEATYCKLTAKDDGIIDWNLGAAEIEARIRAYTPWPLCRTTHAGEDLFILKALLPDPAVNPGLTGTEQPGRVLGKDANGGILVQTGGGVLAVLELQYRARKALGWKAFLNGARNFIGDRLGEQKA